MLWDIMWIWYVFSNPLYLGFVGAHHQVIERRVESLPGLGNCFFSLCISRQSVIWLEALILKPHCLGQDLGFISYGLITLSLCFFTYKKSACVIGLSRGWHEMTGANCLVECLAYGKGTIHGGLGLSVPAGDAECQRASITLTVLHLPLALRMTFG